MWKWLTFRRLLPCQWLGVILVWPRHKDGRRTHAQSSLFQRAQRGKVQPRKSCKDQLKRQLAQAGISHQSWQQEALDRDSWRSSVRKASCEFEAERNKAAKKKRRRQKKKKRAAPLPSSAQTFVCPKCGRECASRIGLYSLQRVCKNWLSAFPTILVCKEWATISLVSVWTARMRGTVTVCSTAMAMTRITVRLAAQANRLFRAGRCYEGAGDGQRLTIYRSYRI